MKQQTKNIEVVIGCVINGEKILLNRRIKEEIVNIDEMWELPGGKTEIGESLECAVQREIYEETGCKVEAIQQIPFHFNISRTIRGEKINIALNCFICALIEEPTELKSNELKIGEIKWFEFDELEFLQIIAGSREFIYWALKNYCSLDFKYLHNPKFGYIYFENIDPKRNHRKKYQIIIEFNSNKNNEDTLYSLSLKYGRIDQQSLTKTDFFRDEFAMHEELLKRINKRIKNNYYIISYDNFPLKDWIKGHEEYLKPSKKKQRLLDFITR